MVLKYVGAWQVEKGYYSSLWERNMSRTTPQMTKGAWSIGVKRSVNGGLSAWSGIKRNQVAEVRWIWNGSYICRIEEWIGNRKLSRIENTQDVVGFYTLLIFIDVYLSQCLIHSRHWIHTCGDGTQFVLFTKSRSVFTQHSSQLCWRVNLHDDGETGTKIK